ncbi:MAG: hypothetical protein IPK26_13780 [Planctomycetes bacterium]|nr:hypothetical protein [Planctomycetota bacterium]
MPLAAQAAWSRVYPATPPAGRQSAAFAFDAARGVGVLFGGAGSAIFADCHVWDGANWSPAASGPSARYAAAMVYDDQRRRIVLFGGYDAAGRLDDTWEWNGTGWLQRSPAIRPMPRSYAAMAYDPGRGVSVLFGGDAGSSPPPLDDLWEWDGNDWRQRTTSHGPGRRAAAQMAFDPVNAAVLMFGGREDQGQTNFDDTWTWNGSVWVQHQPPMVPAARYGHAMATDLHRQRIVLHGSTAVDPFTWEWNGTTWAIRLMASPSSRAFPAMAYDPVRRAVVLFGGYVGTNTRAGDTWIHRTDDPATVTTHGHGCPGSIGVPLLRADGYSLPWLGDTLTIAAEALAPAAAGVVFATGITSAMQDLGSYGMPLCTAWLVPMATDFVPASNGSARWSVAIPAATALVGVRVQQQAFVFEAGANVAGVIASNAAELTVGIR